MNYKILGSDQKEYGPVTLEQLRQWMAEGRVNAQTMVQPEGATDWKPVSNFPELMPLTALAPEAAPAQLGAAGPGKDPATVVRGPAIFLIVVGSLGVLGGLFGLAQNLFGLAMPWGQNLPPDMPPEMARFVKMSQSFGIPSSLLGLGLNLVVLFGGMSMMKLQRWGLALAACIIAMLCSNTCCCPVGLAAGIWGLVVLVKAEIKSVFQ